MSESDLEKRLDSILNKFQWIDGERRLNQYETIDAILTAIKDAGYIHINASQETQAAIANTMLGHKVMTGAEFYTRFWKEYETELPKAINATIIREQVDKIAKRAAGLQDEA